MPFARNNTVVSFPANVLAMVVHKVAMFDSLSGGDIVLGPFDLDVPLVVAAGAQVQFPVNAISVRVGANLVGANQVAMEGAREAVDGIVNETLYLALDISTLTIDSSFTEPHTSLYANYERQAVAPSGWTASDT